MSWLRKKITRKRERNRLHVELLVPLGARLVGGPGGGGARRQDALVAPLARLGPEPVEEVVAVPPGVVPVVVGGVAEGARGKGQRARVRRRRRPGALWGGRERLVCV